MIAAIICDISEPLYWSNGQYFREKQIGTSRLPKPYKLNRDKKISKNFIVPLSFLFLEWLRKVKFQNTAIILLYYCYYSGSYLVTTRLEYIQKTVLEYLVFIVEIKKASEILNKLNPCNSKK